MTIDDRFTMCYFYAYQGFHKNTELRAQGGEYQTEMAVSGSMLTDVTFCCWIVSMYTLQEHKKFRTEMEISLISDTIYNYIQSTILTYQLEYVACIVCVFNITTHHLQLCYVPAIW